MKTKQGEDLQREAFSWTVAEERQLQEIQFGQSPEKKKKKELHPQLMTEAEWDAESALGCWQLNLFN